jgi:hypothetical protein
MSDTDFQKLDKRLKAVEDKLGNGTGSTGSKEPKAPRKSSEYNIFMGKYISDQKKSGSTKSHRDLFADGAKAWKEHKNLKN